AARDSRPPGAGHARCVEPAPRFRKGHSVDDDVHPVQSVTVWSSPSQACRRVQHSGVHAVRAGSPASTRGWTEPRLCAATHVPVYRFPLRRLAQDVQTSAEPVKHLFPLGPVQRQSNPAPRAHWYFAPSTSTGISVATGYAGTLRSNMSADASPTSTSTARA